MRGRHSEGQTDRHYRKTKRETVYERQTVAKPTFEVICDYSFVFLRVLGAVLNNAGVGINIVILNGI